MRKISRGYLKIFFIALVVTIFFCYPYLNNQTIKGHDYEFHLNRIQEISNGIANNGLLPQFVNSNYNNSMGYANSIFYPDLFLNFPAIL